MCPPTAGQEEQKEELRIKDQQVHRLGEVGSMEMGLGKDLPA